MFLIISKRVTLFIVALFLFNLTACTVLGPEYQEPEIDWLTSWQPSNYGKKQVEQKQMDLRFWWTVFNDPILNQLIETARKENPSLQIAGLRIFESRAFLNIAQSTLYPQLQQVNGSVAYVNNQKHGGNAIDRSQSLTAYQTGFSLGWELDFWGRFQRGIESADAAFFASIANQQDIQVLISAQVAQAYFAYRTTQGRILIAHRNAKIQKRSFEITTNIYKNGEGSELDLQQAKTQYLATLASIPDLEVTLNQNLNALSVLLGQAPGQLELSKKLPNDYRLPVVAEQTFDHIPASLLSRRPDIRTAAWQVATQSAQIGIAEADYYPSISVFGTVGWSGNTLSGSSDVSSVSFGPGFTWNVFDYGRIGNNIRIQDARLQQLIEQYQNQVLQAAQEVNNATYKLFKNKEQQLILDETVVASKRSLAIANIRYREGYADFQRVLDAQRTMFTQTERQWLNQGNYVATVISLYKALGGGWTEMAVDKLIKNDIRNTMEERSDWEDLLTTPIYQTQPVTQPVTQSVKQSK
jgi:NodT family efflux transporter outer membrane factor (OMF) lipoprotein